MPNRRLFLTGLLAAPLAAQTAYVPKQSDRPEALEGDGPGFVSMFDGKTLNGWEGDPKYWRVENGAIVGEITPETVVKSNTFIIWKGGAPKDFELKVDYQITSAGNSGINYRSVVIPDPVTPANKFAMRGYQCDIDGQNRYTGQNYEEKGRLFHCLRGQVTQRVEGRKPILLSSFADPKDALKPDWNAVHLVIRGNTLIHMINGQLMCMLIDDDVAGRKMEGQIGVQVHVGPPMKVQYRNFRLKSL
jgi:sulfur transfer complex TusBCD TusB component (DsrH family)